MVSHIIVNRKIYENYKDEIITLSPRLFCDEYFYDLANYKTPIDLNGLKDYLKFHERIIIYATSSFVDFVNILLVVDFLFKENYQGDIEINYYLIKDKTLKNDKLMSKIIKAVDVSELLFSLKEKKKINYANYFLAGMNNFINFFNNLINPTYFLAFIEDEIDEFELSNEEVSNYLYDKYMNMGLNKEFYLNYLKENSIDYDE